jgi:hypothetical protein
MGQVEITTPPSGLADTERVVRDLWDSFRIRARVRIDHSVRPLAIDGRAYHRRTRSRAGR